MVGTSEPLEPLELALLLEAAENLSGLDDDDMPLIDEPAEAGDEDD